MTENKTLRVSSIPIWISRVVLQKYLKGLDTPCGTIAEDSAGNLYISLTPDASDEDRQRFQVATVTFSQLTVNVTSLRLGPPEARFEVTVDDHFRGLTQLNNPKDPVIDIIAVTGLAGHAFGSWRSRERPTTMWLRDFLPGDMEDNGYRARILIYGYDTTLNGSHSHSGVNDHSSQFLEAVKGARGMDPTRPIILIGHSLGGLIIKKAVVLSFEEGQESTLRQCAGMLLFSVPHQGLVGASLMPMVHGQPNENLVQDLCGNSQYLHSLDQSFGHQINPTGMGRNIISFYETKETQTVKEVRPGVWRRSGSYVRMVNEELVKHAAENGQYFSMDADHSSIVKFANRSDQDYQLVRRKLLEIASTISTALTETAVASQERIKICEWLYPGAFNEMQAEISRKRQKNTGGWLLVDDQFISWKENSGPPLLWGCGIPGAGKTYLSSLVIDELDRESIKRTSTTGLAYFYLNYKDQKQQNAVTILSSLIRQLITRPRALGLPLPQLVQSIYNKHVAAGSTPGLEGLQDVLLSSLKMFAQTFIVFDAMDECKEDIRKDLLPLIHWIVRSGARVFLTSRPYPIDIADSLTPTNLNNHVQKLELAAKEEDVRIYIEKTIEEHSTKARDLITGDFRAKVVSRLVDACKGMFLLVHFYIDDLCQYPTTRGIGRALDNIKSTLGNESALDGTYSRVMKSIREQPVPRAALAMKALTWLLTAHRPLSAFELCMAVAMSDESLPPFEGLDTDFFNETDIPDIASILDVCRGLVIIDHTRTIRFAHYSVQEYLEGTHAIGDLADRHLMVALGCLRLFEFRVMCEERFERLCGREGRELSDAEEQLKSRLQRWSRELYEMTYYIEMNLHTHMQACHHIAPTDTLLRFLRNENLLKLLGEMPNRNCDFLELENEYLPLNEATAWGSITLVNHLLDDDMYDCGQYRSTPLGAAVNEGLLDLVQFWLDKGPCVDPNRNWRGGAHLAGAFQNDCLDVARLLLSSDPEWAEHLSGVWNEPLSYVSSVGMLELLLEFGQRIDGPIEYSTLLLTYIEWGNPAFVQFLLRKGARIRGRCKGGCTALHAAAEEGDVDIARLLLQHECEGKEAGGDGDGDGYCYCGKCGPGDKAPAGRLVDARNGEGKTPLHVAARKGHTDFLRFLLTLGRDQRLSTGKEPGHGRGVHERAGAVDPRNRVGRTPLCYADADINILDNEQASPLHYAAMSGDAAAVSLLIEEGLPVDIRDKNHKTPLHFATGDAVAILLERGADPNATDIHGDSAFTAWREKWPAEERTVKDMRLLIKAGVDVNQRIKRGVTPLHTAARWGFAGPVNLLLEHGAVLQARDNDQMSALHHAAAASRSGAISALIEKGLGVDARDIHQRTPLHHAAQKGGEHSNVIPLLLKAGASVDPRDKDRDTPLKHLVVRDYYNSAKILIEAGANMNGVDDNQVSLLHLAAREGRTRIMDLLLDAGVYVNVHDSNQRTPLHHCVAGLRYDLKSTIKHLKSRGANVNAKDINGNTPLQYLLGTESSNWKLASGAKELISVGADVNAVDNDQKGVLHLAARGCSKEILALLLEAGANVHARDGNGRVPLHYAVLDKGSEDADEGSEDAEEGSEDAEEGSEDAEEGSEDADEKIKLLVEKGADVNARDIEGNTPLKHLIDSSWDNGVRILIAAGADVNAVDNSQVSLLHLAAQNGCLTIITLLLDAGASIHVYDSSLATPLDIAINRGWGVNITNPLTNGCIVCSSHVQRLMMANLTVEEPIMNGGSYINETAEQYPGEGSRRKRSHSTAFRDVPN